MRRDHGRRDHSEDEDARRLPAWPCNELLEAKAMALVLKWRTRVALFARSCPSPSSDHSVVTASPFPCPIRGLVPASALRHAASALRTGCAPSKRSRSS